MTTEWLAASIRISGVSAGLRASWVALLLLLLLLLLLHGLPIVVRLCVCICLCLPQRLRLYPYLCPYLYPCLLWEWDGTSVGEGGVYRSMPSTPAQRVDRGQLAAKCGLPASI